MSRILSEVPPNLEEHRRRVFELSENPVIYSKPDWDLYWPFLDSIWLKHKQKQQSDLGSIYKQSYTCRLANRKQSEEQRLENDAKRRRSRRVLTGCQMQMDVHFFKDTVQILRQSSENVSHNHDLDDIDQGKKSTGLRNLIGKLAAGSGNTIAHSFRDLLDTKNLVEKEALQSIGAGHMTVSDIHHAAVFWKQRRNIDARDDLNNANIEEQNDPSTPQSIQRAVRRTSKSKRLKISEGLNVPSIPLCSAPDSAEQSLQGKLMAALEAAREAYCRRNPHSFRTNNESSQYMPGGNTRTVLFASPFPLTFASGKGAELTSIDGDTYLDFQGNYSAGIFGNENQKIRSAVQEALSNGWNFGGQTKYEQQLAKTVCERFRPAMELVRFTNSGTEANMCAIAAAMAFTNRKKIMVFDGGYHGSTISFPKFKQANELNIPHEWVLGSYDHIERTRTILQSLPLYSLAAMIIEPMQGNTGARSCNPEFLRFLRNHCTQFGICLIFDEVQTSRLSYRGLGQKLGIKPDLLTLGKWVGGGMSFGAFGGRRDIMEMFNPSSGKLSHAGTFNNNVVTMAAGCVGCTILDERAIAFLNSMGKRLKDQVHNLLQKKSVRGQMTQMPDNDSLELSSNATAPRMWMSGIGSILSLSFSGEGKEQLQALLYHEMLQENIYLSVRGFIALNLEIREVHIDRFVAALEKFVDRYRDIISEPSRSIEDQQTISTSGLEQPRDVTSGIEQSNADTNGSKSPAPTLPNTIVPPSTVPNNTGTASASASHIPAACGAANAISWRTPVSDSEQWSVRAPVSAEWSGYSSISNIQSARSPRVITQQSTQPPLTFLAPETVQTVISKKASKTM